MFVKSASLAVLALAATVAAQLPNHTAFVNPVGDGITYQAGKNITFGWSGTCVAPSDSTATNPKAAEVQLVNSNDANNAYYVAAVTTIDCTQTQGNTPWVVPSDLDPTAFYSLKIVLSPTPAYSGKFKITGGSGSSATPSNGSTGTTTASTSTPTKSGAESLVPALASAFVASAAALFML
ncbi:hypothetical protein BGZ49_001581 [Haplosporangium sp. Z 27]|nr:hypothetical protein BGZ49_001581 [Haplosporangium sp. Z 27]